jgi:hypothetical protein
MWDDAEQTSAAKYAQILSAAQGMGIVEPIRNTVPKSQDASLRMVDVERHQ